MKKFFSVALMLMATLFCFGQMVEPIKWSSKCNKLDDTHYEIVVTAKIDAGWHLYGLNIGEGGPSPTVFTFDKVKGAKLVGKVTSKSKLISHYDDMFEMELSWYEKSAVFKQPFIIGKDAWSVGGNVTFMACNDQNCMQGTPYRFSFDGEGFAGGEDIVVVPATEIIVEDTVESHEDTATVAAVVANADIYTPVVDQLNSFGQAGGDTSGSLFYIFLMGLLGGLIALVTPCVWPLIPMTVSFFLKRNKDKHKARRDAFLYGLSIIIIYVGLGLIVTAIFGASALNSLSTNAGFNIFFFLLLVVFALSFFGMFEITLPASWSSKMDAKADETTGFLSILLMAFTLSLVSFSCTGPIIGTLLVETAQGSWLSPAIGMLGFAIALALPFSLFAMFPTMLKSLPKSGGWLNSVKVVLGFLELAFSLKFLSVADLAYGWGLLDRETFVALWIMIFAFMGIYLLGWMILPHDDKPERISVMRMMLALCSLSYAIYLVPGLWGAPLKSASAFLPPTTTQDFSLYDGTVHPATMDYEEGLKLAAQSGKPIIVDFSGYGCVNCRKMEAAVWTDARVADRLGKDFVLVSLYVDDRTPLAQPVEVEEDGAKLILTTIGEKNSYIQRHVYGANAQPFYVMIKADGTPLTSAYVFNEDAGDFLDWLDSGKK
ncbi:MAG: thioredoxin family protein [Paludibacteraceae bacterium]|nr:thioredoxin family protein [Paludibacteraceae bacterium]